jgi:hypothetical protein
LSFIELLSLFNSSKEIFGEIKYSSRQITLKLPDIMKFIEDKTFQANILSKIYSPKNQLNFVVASVLREKYSIETNRTILTFLNDFKIRSLSYNFACFPQLDELFNSTGYDCFSGIRELYLFGEGDRNLTSLNISNIEKLRVRYFQSLRTIPFISSLKEIEISNCNQLTDFSIISHVNTCRIIYSKCSDLESLKKIPHLHFENCQQPLDVSVFQSNQSIFFRNCPYFKNIHLVANCKFFSFNREYMGGMSIKSLQDVPNSKEIELASLTNAFKLTYFPNRLIKLTLTNCSHLKKIPSILFHQLISISLVACPAIEKILIPNTSKLTNLQLSQLSSLFKIAFITNKENENDQGFGTTPYPPSLRSLRLNGCHQLNNFQFCAKIPIVSIRQCNGFQSMNQLFSSSPAGGVCMIRSLTLNLCEYFREIVLIPSLQSLSLYFCDGIRSMEGINQIPMLTINNCCRLNSVKGLENKILRIHWPTHRFHDIDDLIPDYTYVGSIQVEKEIIYHEPFNAAKHGEPDTEEVRIFYRVENLSP